MDGISDISKRMCRLCMNEEDVVLYVINENPGFRNFGMPLSWRIMMCVGIAVLPYDNLPQFICHRCLYRVDSYYEFKEKCKECDNLLQIERNTATPLSEKNERKRRERSPSESPEEVEEYGDELPFVMVKSNSVPLDHLTDPLTLSDIESNSQQKEGLCFNASMAASSSSLKGEVIHSVPLVDASETSSLERVAGLPNPSQCAAIHAKRKRKTLKQMSEHKFVNVEDMLKKQCRAQKVVKRVTQDPKLILANRTCRICGIVCTSAEFKEHAMSHMIDESGNKKYTCPVCDKSYSAKSSVRRHVLSHNAVKPYECSVCDRSFSDRSNLMKHEQRHSGLKPYACDLCKTAYADNSYLLKHVRNCHLWKKHEVARHKVVPNTDHECYTKREIPKSKRHKERNRKRYYPHPMTPLSS
ncbi:zinc finger protein 629-like isoform X2 [Cryptotermes secundus]|uniref:zinc finger protein 629-like isoform X2 n=1 Tax=Cryptotermes secundus TaxID=105785 RepID=UPI000CD7BD9D|nr:zinc finger protein 629-like isoform X2 [Cryptotermes secundus]